MPSPAFACGGSGLGSWHLEFGSWDQVGGHFFLTKRKSLPTAIPKEILFGHWRNKRPVDVTHSPSANCDAVPLPTLNGRQYLDLHTLRQG
jgi:hypothetical protein